MFLQSILILLMLNLVGINSVDPELEEEVVRALNFLQYINQRTLERNGRENEANWNYMTNITDETAKQKLIVKQEISIEAKEDWEQISNFHWQTYNDPIMRRQFKIHSVIGKAALPDKKLERLMRIINEMQKIYGTAKVCEYKNPENCTLALEPDLIKILRTSRDPDELKHYWKKWRKAVGPKVRAIYEDYVNLSNEAAKLNNLKDNSEYWLRKFEADDFREQIETIWQQVKPLYLQLHAYVRFKLKEKYGDLVDEDGLIPAHILGDMWAQQWANVKDFTLPFPEVDKIDVTREMLAQNYTPARMFRMADEFFVSIDLSAAPRSFWEKSILEKPNDERELICHPTAWDFQRDNDVRIKQCTTVTEKEFYTAHHEMGHIQYYLQYANQPVVFKDGANPGFHEAVGDVITLSVKSPKHLQEVGLLNVTSWDEKEMLNILYSTGLEKIAFLPYAYILDQWRWDIFQGKINKENWNCKWWDLREEYQGILPPNIRSEEDFDPAAKFHVSADVPYIRYFVSFIIQFQFHRALCIKAGEYKPDDPTKKLHECDIFNNKEAGNLLGKMLQMGSSRPWPDAMETLTGQRTMDASGLLEYFRPLQLWLEQENEKNNVTIGWDALMEKRCRPERISKEGGNPEEKPDDEEEGDLN